MLRRRTRRSVARAERDYRRDHCRRHRAGRRVRPRRDRDHQPVQQHVRVLPREPARRSPPGPPHDGPIVRPDHRHVGRAAVRRRVRSVLQQRAAARFPHRGPRRPRPPRLAGRVPLPLYQRHSAYRRAFPKLMPSLHHLTINNYANDGRLLPTVREVYEYTKPTWSRPTWTSSCEGRTNCSQPGPAPRRTEVQSCRSRRRASSPSANSSFVLTARSASAARTRSGGRLWGTCPVKP